MKKRIIIFYLLLFIATAGTVHASDCGGWFQPPCGSFSKESEQASNNQERLIQSVPIPSLKTSQERANIRRRAELFDNENKISYIYLISYGKVMTFYTVKGKVSSLNSYLVPQEQLVREGNGDCTWSSPTGSCYVTEAPDLDGAYGKNADGVFFFTTEGAYVEWQGDYMMSDQPLKLTTQPEFVRNVQ